ncbi:MAG: hypothetical protein LUD79_08325 [Oscillospiraceae bacterium]|nr:hypothetical protein [Oscillospiraceae bacterium]
MNQTITLAELSADYSRTVACLTSQINALLEARNGLSAAERQQTEARLEALRAIRRESREIASLLLHYYDGAEGRCSRNGYHI